VVPESVVRGNSRVAGWLTPGPDFSGKLFSALLSLVVSVCGSPPERISPELTKRAMSNDIQQDVSVLSAAKHGLVYLTANDWALIADKAVRLSFNKGAAVVEEGKLTNGVYLILKGTARVELPRRVTFPAIAPGEVCGEVSFLDELPATASVIALEPVEAYFLDRPTLQSMFELFPHLASRFYRSLAANLSRRLRDLIGASSKAPATSKKMAAPG